MSDRDWRHLLEQVIAAVERELQLVRSCTSRLTYESKGSAGDLATELDRKIERSLSEVLRSVLPGSAVVGEELGSRGTSQAEWIVDPIDGTTNFAHGVKHVAICVALAVERRPVLAVVHNPFTRKTYCATAG
ncbi:inositol monophosphatase family protein [Lentzea atacamensis]|uniref:Inositol monophosphatase family protein n=1 Tax=Lentzea atacamensis TaxID=531938 RepID=A0A316I9U7_9PSEU|nr:inositol monophosphatase family protein [Lentzea atacamensis]PWK89176.1 inositol monophosphatase family protein [Lentzea atacamensis]